MLEDIAATGLTALLADQLAPHQLLHVGFQLAVGHLKDVSQRVVGELPAHHRSGLHYLPGLVVQPVQAGGDDADQRVRHCDVDDFSGHAPLFVFPYHQPAVQQRADHLLHEERIAL